MTREPSERLSTRRAWPRVGLQRRLVERADGSISIETQGGGRGKMIQKPLLDDEMVTLVEAADRAWALLNSYEALGAEVRELERQETVAELAAALKTLDERVPLPSEDGR